jgi:RNA polymerase sigma factor (sigma-70 family)
MGEAAIRPDELSDDALMARIAMRDASALRIASDAHALAAWRIAYRMLGDPTEAEDVAQESLLKLWNHADRWKPGSSGIASWIKTVSVNQCLDRLRRKRFVSNEQAPDLADSTPLADIKMEEDEVRKVVKNCLESLPERQRAAVILTYYEEQANKSAAAMLTMQLKAFESLLFRARSSLRTCVERKGIRPGDAT